MGTTLMEIECGPRHLLMMGCPSLHEAIDRLLHGRFDGAGDGSAGGQLGQPNSGTGSFDLVEEDTVEV